MPDRLKITKFSDNNLRLLIEMEKKNVTSRSQETYSPFAFYLNIGFLKKHNLVKENGYDNNRRKMWGLTDTGKILVEHLKEIEEILHG